jgi:hypothetical protein
MRLNYEWSFYLELYDNGTNSVLLGNTARIFFETVEEAFRYDIAMSICCLSDPKKSKGKYDNLCVEALVDECPDIEGLRELFEKFTKSCEPVRMLRNKIISHSDLHIALKPNGNPIPVIGKEQIDLIINVVSKILNTISVHYYNAYELLFNPLLVGGAKDLVYWLNEGYGHYCKELNILKGRLGE